MTERTLVREALNSGNPLREKANSDFQRIERGNVLLLSRYIEDRDQERGKECTCNQSAIRSRVSIVEPVSTDQEQRTRLGGETKRYICACVRVSTVEALRSRIERSLTAPRGILQAASAYSLRNTFQ